MRAPSRWAVVGVVFTVDAALALAAGTLPSVPPHSRALALAFLAFPILAIVVPACAASSARVALAVAGSISIVHSAAVVLASAPVSAALAIFAAVLGFGLLVLAITTFLVDVGVPRAVGAAAGALVAVFIVAAPFVAGPILAHPALASVRRNARSADSWRFSSMRQTRSARCARSRAPIVSCSATR